MKTQPTEDRLFNSKREAFAYGWISGVILTSSATVMLLILTHLF